MSDTLFDLKGKTALVTGSSQGLGFEIARGLGRAGATVLLNGRNEDKLEEARKMLSCEAVKAHPVAMDLLDEKQIKEKIARVRERFEAIDILVNNAGIQRRGNLEDFDLTLWHDVINSNLTSAFLVSREVVRDMIHRKSGKIINICSLMSEVGRETTGPYAASKGGLKMLTRAMATEWGRHNIQVNGIGPGYFLTAMTAPLAKDAVFDNWIKQRTPAGRWGNPAELMGTAIYLASDASNFVNGQIIYVDGGILAAL